jgi:hypothetical protein
MTIEDKKQALIDAGGKVRSNASDETVEELYEEHLASISEHGPVAAEDIEPIEDVVSVEVTSETESALVKVPVARSGDILTEFARIRATLGTNQEGERTPAVFDWANENLPAEDFNRIYAGKRYKGEIIKAKV